MAEPALEPTPAERAEAALVQHGITFDFTFVPWSRSRSFTKDAHPKDMNLNWKVTLKVKDREILTTDYSQGIGHCPSFNNHKPGTLRWTIAYTDMIEWECENGFSAHYMPGINFITKKSKTPILPKPADVFYSLMLDGGAIDHPTYESFASDFGYDPDSRKGEAIYRACLEIGLKLRAALGEPALTELRDAFQDY